MSNLDNVYIWEPLLHMHAQNRLYIPFERLLVYIFLQQYTPCALRKYKQTRNRLFFQPCTQALISAPTAFPLSQWECSGSGDKSLGTRLLFGGGRGNFHSG